MNKTITRFSNFVLLAVSVAIAFNVHYLLGIALLFLVIAYFIYRKRDNLFTRFANFAIIKGDTNKALEWLDKAYQVNPYNAHNMTAYGYLLFKAGHIEKAESVLEQLLKPGLPEKSRFNVLLNLALVRWRQNRLDEAVAMLEDVYSRMKTTVLYGTLGYFYIEQGNMDEALRFNLEAYDFNDTNPVIADNLGLACMKLGDWHKAEEVYDNLINLKPTFPEAYYHYGLVKWNKGDLKSAYEYLVKALEYPFTAASTETRDMIEAKRDEVMLLLKNN